MTKKTSERRRIWPMVLGGLALFAILAVILLPRLLVGQATQKPTEVGTFVTQQEQQKTVTLQDKMQQSLANNGSSNSGGASPPNTGNPSNQTQSGNGNVTIDQQMPAGQTNSQNNTQTGNSGQPPNDTGTSGQSGTQPSSQPDSQSAPQNPATIPTTAPANPAAAGKFRVNLGESEISSMIFSGLTERTAPEYRSSIQGVSTRISGGRATITVALLPRYLPDAFLKNLPGVTRDTPTVYVGGEIGLHRDGDTVSPDIYQLSLGNFHVPMPFIRDAVAATVQQQAAQMLRMPNGQQARLDEVILDAGNLTLEGHVN